MSISSNVADSQRISRNGCAIRASLAGLWSLVSIETERRIAASAGARLALIDLMKSLRIGRALGIDIRIHWSFFVLLALIGAANVLDAQPKTALYEVTLTLAVFASVVLHELGHAITARRFGIRTLDITLLPIGGIARLEHLPKRPREEILVGLAGPLVNVALAVLLFALRAVMGAPADGFVASLASISLMLAAFNLLPAFPMDGGRILRAIIASRLDRTRSTRIAARIGRATAAAMFVAGVLYNPLLCLIAIFVWFGATQEEAVTVMNASLEGLVAKDAMTGEFEIATPDDALGATARRLVHGFQRGYPVVEDDRLVGMVTEQDLLRGHQELGPSASVRQVMRAVDPVDAATPLEDVVARMSRDRLEWLPVVYAGRPIGIVSEHRIAQLASIEGARDARRTAISA